MHIMSSTVHYEVHSIQTGQGEPDDHEFTLGDFIETHVRILIFTSMQF